jgi:UDP-3-O-[3-hydroxymyristoyl] glucosamine N-acyltransferase
MIVRKITIKELLDSLQEQYRVLGSMDRYVESPSPIDQADDNSLCFCKKKDEQALEMIKSSRAKVIICSDNLNLTREKLLSRFQIQGVPLAGYYKNFLHLFLNVVFITRRLLVKRLE